VARGAFFWEGGLLFRGWGTRKVSFYKFAEGCLIMNNKIYWVEDLIEVLSYAVMANSWVWYLEPIVTQECWLSVTKGNNNGAMQHQTGASYTGSESRIFVNSLQH
jgi:hypothetical protein